MGVQQHETPGAHSTRAARTWVITPLMIVAFIASLASLLTACSLPTTGGSSHGATTRATPTATSGPTPVSVYVSATYDTIDALDAATGAVRWSVKTTGQPLRPLLAQGILYVASQVNSSIVSGVSYVSALRASDGKQLWRHTLGDFVFNPNSDEALALANGVIYIAARASVYAIRASDGAQLWQATLSEDTAPVAVDGGVVYTMTWSDGPGVQVVALDASTGAIKWQSATLEGGGNTPRAPLVADGVVYADTGGALYALAASDGSPRWMVGGLQGLSITPALVQGILFDGNSDVSAYQPTGESVWSIPKTTSHVNYSLVANATGVYVVSADGYVAYDLTTGNLNWTAAVIFQTSPVWLALAGNTLYAVDDNMVLARRTADGSIMWSVLLPDRVESTATPAVG